MPRMVSGLWAALIWAALHVQAAQAAAYRDPLDTPALLSRRAAVSTLTAVVRVAPDRWVAVGRRGHVLLSKDGNTWEQVPVPVSTDLVSVYFSSAQQGWAVGQGGVILVTSDGGATWTRQIDGRQGANLLVAYYKEQANADKDDVEDAQRWLDGGPGRPFLDVWSDDGKRGFAVGAFNLLFATEDGGRRWVPAPGLITNPGKLHLNAVRSVAGDLYVAGEQGLLARFNAAGRRFDMLKTPYAGSFFGLVGRAGLLVAFGLQGNVYRSRDNGVIWQKVETGVQATVTCGAFIDDGRLVLGTQSGLLLVSADNADSFKSQQPSELSPIYGVAPAAANAVIVVGARGVRREPLQ